MAGVRTYGVAIGSASQPVCVGRRPERAMASWASPSVARAWMQKCTSSLTTRRCSTSGQPANHAMPSAIGRSPWASSLTTTSRSHMSPPSGEAARHPALCNSIRGRSQGPQQRCRRPQTPAVPRQEPSGVLRDRGDGGQAKCPVGDELGSVLPDGNCTGAGKHRGVAHAARSRSVVACPCWRAAVAASMCAGPSHRRNRPAGPPGNG